MFIFRESVSESVSMLSLRTHCEDMTTDKPKPQVKTSIYLDTREAKRTKQQRMSGTYAVKIRVWDSEAKASRFYPTGIEMTDEDFKKAMKPKPTRTHIAERDTLNAALSEVNADIAKMQTFNFDELHRMRSGPTGDTQDAFSHFECVIAELNRTDRVGTAKSYQLAMNALKAYHGKERLLFKNVTVRFLTDFEAHLINNGRSLTTVGIYLRALRVMFNKAMEENHITKDIYPFGRGKYVIEAGSQTKRALTAQQLNTLMNAPTSTPEQERARDFWFWSMASDGMNMKDIALLRWENFDWDIEAFTYYRAKTYRTKRANLRELVVSLIQLHHDIMNRHGNPIAHKGYVFPILKDGMDAQQRFRAVQAFTRYVNQHMKRICEANGLPAASTYWARHTFANRFRELGGSWEDLRDRLNHDSVTTTEAYGRSIIAAPNRKVTEDIMNFGQ